MCAREGVGIVLPAIRQIASPGGSRLALGMGDGPVRPRGEAPSWEGKADGFGSGSVKPVSSGEWIETTPSHHALFVQWQDGRPISGQTWFDSTTEHQFTDR